MQNYQKGIERYLMNSWENTDLILVLQKGIELYDLCKEVSRQGKRQPAITCCWNIDDVVALLSF